MKKIKYDFKAFDFDGEKHITNALDILNKVFKEDCFTRSWWEWKYNQNPFGKPLGWYAQIPGENCFVGLRLLWPWQFYKNGESRLFYQAVDTATDPNHERLGIFSKLTKMAIDEVERQGCFIYNFPNSNSYLGYKKLGWADIDRQSWYVEMVSLLKAPKVILKLLFKPAPTNLIDSSFLVQNNNINISNESDFYCTQWNNEALQWRFGNHPRYKYYYFSFNEDKIIYKINNRKGLQEAQIVVTQLTRDDTLRQFKKLLAKFSVDFVSYNGLDGRVNAYFRNSMFSRQLVQTMNYVIKVTDSCKERGIKLRLELGEMDYF